MLLKQSRHAICCHVAPLQNPPSKSRRVYSVLHLLFVVVQTFTVWQRLVFFVRVLTYNSISLILVSLSLSFSLSFCFLFISSNFELNYTHKNFPPTNTKTLLNTSSRILLLRSATDSVLIKTNMLSGFWLRFLSYIYIYIYWSDKRCKFNMSGPLDRFARPCEYSCSCSFSWYLFSSKILVLIFLICSCNSWILFDCL